MEVMFMGFSWREQRIFLFFVNKNKYFFIPIICSIFRWEIGGQGQQGYLIDQKIKELHPKLPVVNVLSVRAKDKKHIGQYQCPVYVTSLRGMTYVFTANLNMESEDSDDKKWILAGVCLLLSDD